METCLKLAAALLPAILMALYIWYKDPHKEPGVWLVRAFFLGVAISVPVVYVENFINGLLFAGGEPTSLFGSTLRAFFVAALPEESAKLFALWLIVHNNKHFDEHFDGIVYAVFVSLGFAAIENVGYVFMSGEAWVSTAIARSFLAVPGHYAFAILMGYYYALYFFVDRSKKNAASILFMPILAHGVYDAIAMGGSVSPLLGGISSIVLIYFCIKLQRNAQSKVSDLIAKNNSHNNALI